MAMAFSAGLTRPVAGRIPPLNGAFHPAFDGCVPATAPAEAACELLCTDRHDGMGNILFVDGSVFFVRPKGIQELKWTSNCP